MTPYLQDADCTLYHGDVSEVLRSLPAESVDCVITSPPYEASGRFERTGPAEARESDWPEGRAGGAQGYSRADGDAAVSIGGASKCKSARRAVRYYAGVVAMWAAKMGAVPTGAGEPATSCPLNLSRVLRQKARAWRVRWERWFERTYEKWRCIHEHEGAWDSNTGNGYNGGLQMTPWFQATYGAEFLRRWGPAHRWPVWAQLIAAERAYVTTGFRQWPNTARMCGLL